MSGANGNAEADAEQAKVDAIYTHLRAVADHDRWPRELYFSGI